MHKILKPENVIIQGITGKHGSFHTKNMLAYGTNIIAGTSFNKNILLVHGVKVFKTISDIKNGFTNIDASVVFVPPQYAKDAILEAIDNEIPLIVCITEGIPVHDMLIIKQHLQNSSSVLVGPNCPGILFPGELSLGIIPSNIALPGKTAVVSRSGTLTYEAVSLLTQAGIGQKYIIGIGGDPVKGSDFTYWLDFFEKDTDVSKIVLIGEIGGKSELEAARFISKNISKPVVGYITGHSAPPNTQLGHAGAILKSEEESADFKTKALARAGVHMCNDISFIPDIINKI